MAKEKEKNVNRKADLTKLIVTNGSFLSKVYNSVFININDYNIVLLIYKGILIVKKGNSKLIIINNKKKYFS